MPSHAIPSSRSALVPVFLAFSLPLGAQAAIPGADVNAASDSGRQRSPLGFGSAYTLPRGARGMSFQYGMRGERERGQHSVMGETSFERQYMASTLSTYWGVRDWLTLGGSLEFSANEYTFFRRDPSADPVTGRPMYANDASFGPSDARVFGRARLYRSRNGGTQVALNTAASVFAGQLGLSGSRSAASVGLAFAQRAGPFTLHLAPSYEARDNDGSFPQVAGAVVFPLLPRVSASLEGAFAASRRGDWNRAATDPISEVGGGLRFDLGRVKLDLGLRQSLGDASGPSSASRFRMVFGTHVKF